ncbi:GntR family transcriptional regulator [Pseudoxanthomonas sp. UTMC 1351]|uniref:GntR family transcriptional regulator n=1 Tax=Pseudoxanthomonas sp. UTMC 1351 TaxID=2695853 RepID=UPI0034CD0AF2
MTRTHARVPRYIEIADDLRIAIENGELAPGDPIPSMAELERRYGVSEAVVRAAVRSLKAQALISTSQGRRPTVRRRVVEVAASNLLWVEGKKLTRGTEEERLQIGSLESLTGRSIHEDDSELDPRFTQTTADEATPGFDPGTPVLHREYRTLDRTTGVLLLWSESWLPLDLARKNPALLDEETEPWAGGTLHQLWTVDVEIVRRDDTITARPATTVEAQRWDTEPGSPLLIVSFVAYDTDDNVAVSGRAIYPADRSSLEYTTQIPTFADIDRQAAPKEG